MATDGSTCSSFVQEFPFYSFYKVAILRPKIHGAIPTDAFYFVAYLLHRERWRYVYARKFGKARISSTALFGPVNSEGKPDFEMMAELTRQCRAYSVIRSFREAYRVSVRQKFSHLVEEWKADCPPTSSVAKMSKHPAYGAIVSMGTEAIPLLLEELAKRADHWFAALNRITGEDPVPVEGRGKLNEMRDAWIHWGRERAYLK